MDKMGKTSIIIISYNTYEYTKLCIESIRKYTLKNSYDLIVVDNGSKDESVKWLKKQRDIKCIFNRDNAGFPKGCNQGMELAKGTEILLLNSDTIVTPRWLEQLKKALYSDKKIGAVSCVTNKCSNLQEIKVPYTKVEEIEIFADKYNHSDPSLWKKSLTLVGFCFLFKREIYKKIGGLDEIFTPGNFEDDDYSLRIWQLGYELLVCKDTFIHHFGSASFTKSRTQEELSLKAKQYNELIKKNFLHFQQKWGVSTQYKIISPLVFQLPDKINEQEKIIQLGCGVGMDLFLLAEKYPKATLFGVCENSNEVSIAGRAFAVKYVDCIENNIKKCFDKQYDYILINLNINQLHDSEMFLREVKTFLLPNGKVYFEKDKKVFCVEKKEKKQEINGMILPVNFANFDPTVRKIYLDQEQKKVAVTLGPGSYLVNASLEYGNNMCHVLIGRYCSLGHRLIFEIGLNHDYKQVTTYPFDDLFNQDKEILNHADDANSYQIIIGNDVWIGCDVTIMGGVHIGNGAVIGAGAVVAKDIPPYAVVVGNPAKVIKYRFTDEAVLKLQKIKWWNWSEHLIKERLPLMKNIENFVKQFYTDDEAVLSNSELNRELQNLRDMGYVLCYFIPDFTAPQPIWKDVLRQYLQQYKADDKIALMIELQQGKFLQEVEILCNMITEKGENAPLVLSHTGSDDFSLQALQKIDFFIINREDVSSQCIDYALDFGFKIVSGINHNIFREIKNKC